MPGDSSGPLAALLSWFTRHRTASNLLMVFMLAVGLVSLPKMRTQFFPDLVVENIIVSVEWDGASAEDIDSGIVQILEPVLLSVEGVLRSSSNSYENRGEIWLEFEPDWDVNRAADDVQSALDLVTTLPADAEEPLLRRGGWSEHVTHVIITGPVDTTQLALLTDEFVARLFDVGVTRTVIEGIAAPEIIVEIPVAQLVAHDLTMSEIANLLAAEITSAPAGDMTGALARVRTGVQKRDPEALARVALRSSGDGATLTLGEIAKIRVEGVTRDEAFYVGDDPAMSIRVERSAQGDAIGIQAAVQKVVDEMTPSLPEGVRMTLIRKHADTISSRIEMLRDNALTGLALVLALLFLFLNARTAFWVAAGIPVAMMAAIALMYAAGLTFNMISLFAIIITLGIVVDDAIVVGEHADARVRQFGETPVLAAERAARRMALPVFAATITTVIAFFGLTVIGGHFGRMIYDIPFTVIAVLLASLVECFLILPNHMAHSLTDTARTRWYDWPSRWVNQGFEKLRTKVFRRLVAWAIQLRYAVLAGAVLLLATQIASFIRGDVTWRFFNAPEQGTIAGNFAMAPGAGRADTQAMMRSLQSTVEKLGLDYEIEYGSNPIAYVVAQLGSNAGRGMAGEDTRDSDLLGGISIELIDADLRPYSSFDFLADLQERAPQHPLLETLSFRSGRSGPGGDAIDIQLYGGTPDTLKRAAEALKTALARFPEVSALEDNLAYDKVERILELTPQGAALGFNTGELGRVLRNLVNGIEAASFPEGSRSTTVRVELPDSDLGSDFVERTQMRTSTGDYVPLADIVRITERIGFSAVRRENGLRTISVTGDISGDDPARAAEITSSLQAEILPDIAGEYQVDWRLSGLSEQEADFLDEARTGMILTLLGIYLVLALVLASWTRPIIVMAIIPFGLIGTIWGHSQWDVPLSMFTVVGLLGLSGIIVNDSIVLVGSIDKLARDRDLRSAIIEGASDRLRPVLLTTLTTVFGLAPLLFERSVQAQFLKPTVITLVYGLSFGMVLVLLLVPALLCVNEDFARQFRSLRRGLRDPGKRLGATGYTLRFAVLGMLVWFGATMGATLVTGHLPAAYLALLPGLERMPPLAASMTLFLSGTLLMTTGIFLVALKRLRHHAP